MKVAIFIVAMLTVVFTSQSTANRIHKAIRRK